MDLKVSTATRSPVLTPTKFKGYDLCINPYVGCQFGCKYCYVRFFVKDDEKPWGEFVRLREHIKDKLPKELQKAAGKRIVFGTMTDPYQPIERTHRLTRTALEILLGAEHKPNKVGIFTRSPIVTEDLDLIKKLPRARIHLTITPFERSIMSKIEPIAISTQRRWATIQAIKEAGVRAHVNVSPAVPLLSEQFTEEFAKKMTEIGVDEFYVDPMQAYGEAMTATKEAIGHIPEWKEIEKILSDNKLYKAWKTTYRDQWFAVWRKLQPSKTLGIWQDHVTHTTIDMATGAELDRRRYGDDLEVEK